MEKLIDNVNNKSIVLQVDFSENATLACQNEIQSVHWQHSQATIFTAHAWINTQERESIVVISDDLEHTKLAIYTFISKVLSLLREKYHDFHQVDIFQMVLVVNLSKGFSFQTFIFGEKGSIVKCTGTFLLHHMGKVSLMG